MQNVVPVCHFIHSEQIPGLETLKVPNEDQEVDFLPRVGISHYRRDIGNIFTSSEDYRLSFHSISSYHGYRIKNKDYRHPFPQDTEGKTMMEKTSTTMTEVQVTEKKEEISTENEIKDDDDVSWGDRSMYTPKKRHRLWPPSPLPEVKKMEKPEATTAENDINVDNDGWTTDFTLLGLNVAKYGKHSKLKTGELKKFDTSEREYFVIWQDGKISNSWSWRDVFTGLMLYEQNFGAQKNCALYNAPRKWCIDNDSIGLPIIGMKVADFFDEAVTHYKRINRERDSSVPFIGEVIMYSKAYEELDVPTAQGWPNDLYVIKWECRPSQNASRNRQLLEHMAGRYPTIPGSSAYTNDEFLKIFWNYRDSLVRWPYLGDSRWSVVHTWTSDHITVGIKLAKLLPDLSLEYTFGWKVYIGEVVSYAETLFYQVYRIQWQNNVADADDLSRASISYQRNHSRDLEEEHNDGAAEYYNTDEVIAGQKLLEVWTQCGSRFPKIRFESTFLNDRPNRGVDYHSVVDKFLKKLHDIPALSPFNCIPPGKYMDLGLPSPEYREFLGAGKCHVIGFRKQFDGKLNGIFALQSISSNTFLGRLHGEVLNFSEAMKRLEEPGPSFVTKFAPNLHVYLCSRNYGNVLKLMNHHCTNANCVARSFVDFDGSLALGMWSMSDIQAGDDLFCDYRFRFSSKIWDMNCMTRNFQSPCMCGTCPYENGISFKEPMNVCEFPYMKKP